MATYRTKERLVYIKNPEQMGFRFVGRVTPEFRSASDMWDRSGDTGWHTDPFGDVFKDGTGLLYGVVYQLPSRRGHTRFVAGYQEGGPDDGVTLDLAHVYESEGTYPDEFPKEHDGAHEAAHAADYLAKRAAEEEREYQTAWHLGQIWAEAGEEIERARKETLALLKERRMAKQSADANLPNICRAIRKQVVTLLDTIREARDKRRRALEGDGPDYLSVYMSDDAKAAFCDGAGIKQFPA